MQKSDNYDLKICKSFGFIDFATEILKYSYNVIGCQFCKELRYKFIQ